MYFPSRATPLQPLHQQHCAGVSRSCSHRAVSVCKAAASSIPTTVSGRSCERALCRAAAPGIHTARPTSVSRDTYHFLDTSFPGVELLHEEPPVYLVHNFLQPGHCHALQQAALNAQLPTAAYNDAVLFDYQRLSYLGIVVAAGAAAQAGLALQQGMPFEGVLASAAAAAACWSGVASLLAVGIKAAVEAYTGGKVFTGSKWSTSQLQQGSPAAEATVAFVNNACRLLDTQPSKLELPLVTRYCKGEYQRVHYDARPPGDSQGAAAWLAAGGQRLVQVVVYLNSLEPHQGGATAFHHPALGGLSVQPELGAALLFFPAYADGRVDARMPHSGGEVLDGEKWIINTWIMQYDAPDSGAAKAAAAGAREASRAAAAAVAGHV